VSTAAFTLFIRPKGNGWSTGVAGMVLGKWKMVMVAPHTHFLMTGSQVKQPRFTHVIGTWHLMVFCRCTVCILSSQAMFYILDWVLVVYHIL
jgi:hypothetical protein